MPKNKIKLIYDTISQDYDLGSYDDFYKVMHDPNKRELFHRTVGAEYDLGDYGRFESALTPHLAPIGPPTSALQQPDTAQGVPPELDPNQPVPETQAAGIVPTPQKPVATPETEDSIGDPWKRGLKKLVESPGLIFKAYENLLPESAQKPFKDIKIPDDAPEEYKKFLQGIKDRKPISAKAEYFEKAASDIKAQEATGKYAKSAESFAEYLDPKRIYMTLAENLPQMAGFMATTLANPYVGFLTMSAVESGDAIQTIEQYEKDTGKKVPDEYKKLVGTTVGVFNGLLERAGISSILKIAKIPGMKGKLIQYLTATQTEGVTETLQELNQLIVKMGYTDIQPKEWNNLVDAYYAGNILALVGGAGGLATKGFQEPGPKPGEEIVTKEGEVEDAEEIRRTAPPVPKEPGGKSGQEEGGQDQQLPTQKEPEEVSGSVPRPTQKAVIENKDDGIRANINPMKDGRFSVTVQDMDSGEQLETIKIFPADQFEKAKSYALKVTNIPETAPEPAKPAEKTVAKIKAKPTPKKKPKAEKQQFRKIEDTEDAVKFGLYEITDEQEIRDAIKRLSAESIKLSDEGKSAKDVTHQKQMLSEALGEKIKKFVVYKPALKPGEEGRFEETEYTSLQQELRDRVIKQEGVEPEVTPEPTKGVKKKLVITNADKKKLRDLGYTPADYRKFTPDQAQDIIEKQTQKEVEPEPTPDINKRLDEFASRYRKIGKEDLARIMENKKTGKVPKPKTQADIDFLEEKLSEAERKVSASKGKGKPVKPPKVRFTDIFARKTRAKESKGKYVPAAIQRKVVKTLQGIEDWAANQGIRLDEIQGEPAELEPFNQARKLYSQITGATERLANMKEAIDKGYKRADQKRYDQQVKDLDDLIKQAEKYQVKDLTKKPTKKKAIPEAERNIRRHIRDTYKGLSEQDYLDHGVIEIDRKTGKRKIIERGLYMQLGGIGEGKLDDIATELIGETTGIPSDVLWEAIYDNKKLGQIGQADPFATDSIDAYERQLLEEAYTEAQRTNAIPDNMTLEEFIAENTAKNNNSYSPPESDTDALFEPGAKYNTQKRIVQITDFDAISLDQWAKVDKHMKEVGYDYRGPEDARELFRIQYQGRNIFSGDHADALRYALNLDVPPEIRQLMKDAKDFFHLTESPEKAGFLLPDGKMLNLNRDLTDRAYDHSEIEAFMPDEIKKSDSHYANYKVLAWDNVNRMSVSGSAKKKYFKILLGSKPTPAQVKTLRKIFNTYPYDVMIDLVDQGNDTDYLAYSEGTRADKILHDISYYFDKGYKPPVSPLLKFRSPQVSLNLFTESAKPKAEPEIKFKSRPKKTMPKEMKHSYRPLNEGEDIILERKYKRSKYLKFFARSTQISSPEDVAYLFRQLEGEAQEHVYVLHITAEGKPIIQHLTTGSFNQSLMTPALLNDSIERFGTTEMYFIHNHPSGVLKPSDDDIASLAQLRDAFPQLIIHDGVIIDTYKNQFVTFDQNAGGRLGPTDKGKDVKELPALVFSQLYFRKPNELAKNRIGTPSDVAGYVSGLRFSPDEKVMVITTNNNFEVVGRFYLSPESQHKPHLAAREIAALTARSGGNAAFLAVNGNSFFMGDHGDGFLRLVRESLEKKGITVPDVVRVEPNSNTTKYKSLHEAGESFFQDVNPEYEKEFVKKKAADGVDVRKIDTVNAKIEKREKLKEKLAAQKKKGQEDIFEYTEKKKQTDLFGEPLSEYAKSIPFRNGDIQLPDSFEPKMPEDTLMGKLERVVADEIKLRIFEHAKAKAGGNLSDQNDNRYLKLRSELTARVDKVIDQMKTTFDFWLTRHRGGEEWFDQLFDVSGEQGLYSNGKEAFGIYEYAGYGPKAEGEIGLIKNWEQDIDVRQEIVDRHNEELAIHVPETEEELIKDLRGRGFDDEIKRVKEEYEYAEDQLRELWYEHVEPELEGYPEVYDVGELAVYWDGDWNNDIGQVIKEVMETSGYEQWREIFKPQGLVEAEKRIEQAFAKMNSAKSLNDKLAAINIGLNVEHVFGKMAMHLDLDQGELTRLSDMGNEIVSLETTPRISEPVAEYKFENENIEAEYQASHGVPKPSIAERIKEKFTQLKHELTRGKFEFLPRTAEFAQIRSELLRLGKQKDVAHQKTLDAIDNLSSDMSKNQYSMFERLVLLSDLMEEIQNDHPLPGNWTNKDVEYEYNRLLAEADDTVKRAFTNRKQLWEEIKDAYIEAQEAIGHKVEGRFDRGNYFRHQVLEFANAKGLTGTGKRLKTPTGRGFLKQREGSRLSINTNYLQAEYEVMSQMLYDIQRARVIEAVDRIHNIQDQLKSEAKSANEDNVMPFFEEIAEQMTASLSPTSKRGPYTPEEAFRIYLNTKIAIGMSKLGKMAASGSLPSEVNGQDFTDVTEDLSEVHNINQAAKADFPDEPEMWRAASLKNMGRFFYYIGQVLKDPNAPEGAKIGAATVFKGIREKNEFIKEALGDRFQTWETMIPEGYVKWQPREGQVVYFANSIPERAARDLFEGAMEQVGVNKDMIRKVMSIGGARKEYVVPEELANQLDKLVIDTQRDAVSKFMKWSLTKWKIWTLISPRRYFKYNARNMTGDADAVFVGNPRGFRKLPRATSELYQVFTGQKKLEDVPDLNTWFEHGGMGTLLQAQEMGDLNKLKQFKKFDKKMEGKTDLNIIRKYFRFARLSTDMREAMLRYANYLDYLEQINESKDNKPKNYGASIPAEVDALETPEDKAFWMSNDLLGAYDDVSVFGQQLRSKFFPFWSWKEVNFKRYIRFIKNAANSPQIAEIVGRSVVKGAPIMAMRVGSYIIRAVGLWSMLQAWNHLLFSDEEDDLPRGIKKTPHLILGRNDKGEVIYFNRLGALGDFLEWFGLQDAPYLLTDWMNGRSSLGEVAEQMGKAPVNVFIQGARPEFKITAELASGKSFFPDVFKARTIKNKGLHVARGLGLENEFIAIRDLPSKGYTRSLRNFFVYEIDPAAAAYMDIYDAKDRYIREVRGESGGSFAITSPKSMALYNMKVALRYQDKESAEKYFMEYLNYGGTGKGLRRSILSMHPKTGLKKEELKGFLEDYLTPEERRKWDLAVKFFDEVIAKDVTQLGGSQ